MSRRPGLIKGAPTRTWDIYREWPTGMYHDGLHGESDGRKDIPWDTKGGQIGKAIEVPWRTRPGKSPGVLGVGLPALLAQRMFG